MKLIFLHGSVKKVPLSALSAFALFISLTIQPGYSMEQRKSYPLDYTWKDQNCRTNIENVINMTISKTRENKNNNNYYAPKVCVIDTPVNKQVFSTLNSPVIHQDLRDTHGTHVAKIIEELSPAAKITSYYRQKLQKDTAFELSKCAADDFDVLNLSFGIVNLTDQEYMTERCPFYQMLITSLNLGKIVVKSLGNDQMVGYSQEEIDAYIVKFIKIAARYANDSAMNGLLILVGNSTYENDYEMLRSSSTRSYTGYNEYIITAPGTDITAIVDTRENVQKRWGSSNYSQTCII
jgi:hypothetical protein